MTTYTPIANSEIDQDSPVTQPLMTALRDNPIAIAEGASGAPKVANAALDPVARAALKTATASASGTLTSRLTVALSPYSFFPSITSNGQNATMETVNSGAVGADAPRFSLNPTLNTPYAVQWRYINA